MKEEEHHDVEDEEMEEEKYCVQEEQRVRSILIHAVGGQPVTWNLASMRRKGPQDERSESPNESS
jgi:hypothetical protein